jgi:proteasome lid subunit RPN8/RPN11
VTVSFSALARDETIAHALQARPAECCGLLLGRDEAIVEAARVPNVASNPNRFLMDPGSHIALRRAARERGLDVVGFYHSHPHSPALPSPTDVAEAAYPDHFYLIVGLMHAEPETRLYRLRDGHFVETPFAIIESGRPASGSSGH